MGRDIDAISLEVMWQRLISIMDELDDAIVKSTFSTILSESRDFACILTDPHGRSLCQSNWSTPNFCVVLPRAARTLQRHFPLASLRPGDVVATNDPWIGTGHLPDYVLLMPIFHAGTIVACIGTVSHMSDVGGHPGEIEASDVYSEGLRMPPFKLYERGHENALAFDIIGANCRAPDLLLGDLRALAGAGRIGAQRITEFLADYRLDDLTDLSHEILRRSEDIMRRRIAALPDGIYDYAMEIDGYIDTVRLCASITIASTNIHVDYSGSAPQRSRASINSSLNSTIASSMYPFKCALAPDIPNNEALFRPIRVTAPQGSILNATFPAPVKARAKTINNLNQVLFGALWPIFGEHAQASNGSIWPLVLKGTRDDGTPFLVDMLPYGGGGGLSHADGMPPIAFPTNSTITPCEVIETQAPIRFHQKALRPDTGGLGRHRGGLGQVITFEHVGREPMTFSLTPDRITTEPHGLAGGRNAARGEVLINDTPTYRFPAIQLQRGDTVELRLPGGGGFGPPDDREPGLLRRDLQHGYATTRSAPQRHRASSSALEQTADEP